jgi:hypothetical protein
MIDCPNCRSPMSPQAALAFKWVTRPVEVDCCAACSLLWFDQSESTALTPEAVLAIFQLIARAGAPQHTLSAQFGCPRCRHGLAFTHDVARNARFTYWRCANGDGRLITFGQFLAEKGLVRAPSADELAKLRATVKQISCSQCGAPINLATDTACTHCGAAVAMIDPDAIAKALREFHDGRGMPAQSAPAPTRVAMSDAQLDALFDLERMREHEGTSDLLAIGAAAVGALLSGILASR